MQRKIVDELFEDAQEKIDQKRKTVLGSSSLVDQENPLLLENEESAIERVKDELLHRGLNQEQAKLLVDQHSQQDDYSEIGTIKRSGFDKGAESEPLLARNLIEVEDSA